ncbi:MAG TPA: HlyD family efflux transporter periplasmic adaptor subunit [Candidatus Acidoferrum sp.]|jgi:HlyD family secretion protein|nr:HlyD family efflux transporter periplasmic adaptor subunit [Candidatus Acidoferrum sp.]
MNLNSPPASIHKLLLLLGSLALAPCVFTSCSRPNAQMLQGYVEGEFVYVASPLAGALETLNVKRGSQVKPGDLLFALDSASEKDARDGAEGQLRQAEANWQDAQQGKRPTEIESLEAQLQQARATLALSEKELARQEEMAHVRGATAQQDVDRARSLQDQDHQKVAQLEADLKTAQLGSRTNQVAAAAANVKAMQARLAKAEWDLSQKHQSAPQAGLVFDTLYREGEWVAAGRPVVALLPPQNVKVRVFVPQTILGAIHPGDSARVTVDGAASPYTGKVSFISPQAEYTPPVLYSQENRDKLVFLVELVFEPETAANLHPGQPVDVQFGH